VLPDDDPDSSQTILTEQSPHEPEEFDPDSLGPPVPEAPSPPEPSAEDLSSDAAGLFWILVIVFNAALLALSLGPMLAYFEGQVDLGLQVFLGGVVLFAYGSYRYVKFTRDQDEGDSEGNDEGSGVDDSEGDDISDSEDDGVSDSEDDGVDGIEGDDEGDNHNG